MPRYNSKRVASLLSKSLVDDWGVLVEENWGSGDWVLEAGETEYSVDTGNIRGGPRVRKGSIVVPVSMWDDENDVSVVQKFRVTVSFNVEPVGEPVEDDGLEDY